MSQPKRKGGGRGVGRGNKKQVVYREEGLNGCREPLRRPPGPMDDDGLGLFLSVLGFYFAKRDSGAGTRAVVPINPYTNVYNSGMHESYQLSSSAPWTTQLKPKSLVVLFLGCARSIVVPHLPPSLVSKGWEFRTTLGVSLCTWSMSSTPEQLLVSLSACQVEAA